MLLTRAWPQHDAVDEFDSWQEGRHFPELVGVPGVERAEYFRVVERDIAQVLQGSGNRIAVYWSVDLEPLMTFLTHPGLAVAVEDGSRFFPQFNELDGDRYTGNIYRLGSPARGSGGDDDHPDHDSVVILVERYEVPADARDEFDQWVREVHVAGLLELGRRVCVRVGHAVRANLPIPYYNSPGSDLVLTTFGGSVRAIAHDPRLLARLGDAQRWDRRLVYVRRELAELGFDRDREPGRG